MTNVPLPIRVVALYRFTPLGDCGTLREPLVRICRAGGVKGTLLLAGEGINGTIAGSDSAIDDVLAQIRSLPGCTDLEIKEFRADRTPFHRLKVRIKAEIVTMGEPGIDPQTGTGHYVAPSDWHALIDRPGTLLIDTRNDYEVAVGSFAGAINPRTRSFRDFPAWFRKHRDQLFAGGDQPHIAMFCTGGIRCEKATAFLKTEGIADVYHLKGGILAYLEAVPATQSRWQGECFVFDQRVSVAQGLAPGSHELCHACRRAVNVQDRSSPLYAAGISCPSCHWERTDGQREGYRERQRQQRLAQERGAAHIGAVLLPHGDG